MERSLNVLALVKDGERFVFLYDNHSAPQVLQTLGKFAADPELCFTWYDAAVLSLKVRKLQETLVSEDEDETPFRRAARGKRSHQLAASSQR